METGIIREATVDEKKDYIEIGRKLTVEQQFRLQLADEETRSHKVCVPFCRKCAYDEFEDKKTKILKDYERKYGEGASIKIKLSEFEINWKKFQGKEHFKLLDESEVVEDKLLDGMRTSAITGKNMNYQCKDKRYRVTIFVSKDKLALVK